MADKGFVLTLVAVLALAVVAGSLRNNYSGALSAGRGGGEFAPERAISTGRGESYSAIGYKTVRSPEDDPCLLEYQQNLQTMPAETADRILTNCHENMAQTGRIRRL